MNGRIESPSDQHSMGGLGSAPSQIRRAYRAHLPTPMMAHNTVPRSSYPPTARSGPTLVRIEERPGNESDICEKCARDHAAARTPSVI